MLVDLVIFKFPFRSKKRIHFNNYQSEYLSKIDMNIIDTFLLESYTILIIALEYLKT